MVVEELIHKLMEVDPHAEVEVFYDWHTGDDHVDVFPALVRREDGAVVFHVSQQQERIDWFYSPRGRWG